MGSPSFTEGEAQWCITNGARPEYVVVPDWFDGSMPWFLIGSWVSPGGAEAAGPEQGAQHGGAAEEHPAHARRRQGRIQRPHR